MMLSVETVKNRYTFLVIWFGYFVLRALYIRPVLTKASADGNALDKTQCNIETSVVCLTLSPVQLPVYCVSIKYIIAEVRFRSLC